MHKHKWITLHPNGNLMQMFSWKQALLKFPAKAGPCKVFLWILTLTMPTNALTRKRNTEDKEVSLKPFFVNMTNILQSDIQS